eukprot:746839-Hanusia_phi.AAC.11
MADVAMEVDPTPSPLPRSPLPPPSPSDSFPLPSSSLPPPLPVIFPPLPDSFLPSCSSSAVSLFLSTNQKDRVLGDVNNSDIPPEIHELKGDESSVSVQRLRQMVSQSLTEDELAFFIAANGL